MTNTTLFATLFVFFGKFVNSTRWLGCYQLTEANLHLCKSCKHNLLSLIQLVQHQLQCFLDWKTLETQQMRERGWLLLNLAIEEGDLLKWRESKLSH